MEHVHGMDVGSVLASYEDREGGVAQIETGSNGDDSSDSDQDCDWRSKVCVCMCVCECVCVHVQVFACMLQRVTVFRLPRRYLRVVGALMWIAASAKGICGCWCDWPSNKKRSGMFSD